MMMEFEIIIGCDCAVHAESEIYLNIKKRINLRIIMQIIVK